MTKSERLLREMKSRRGMTHREIVQFLLDLRDGFGNTTYDYAVHGDCYNALLYGTRGRTGLLEKYCDKDETTGEWKVVRVIEGPFTQKRRTFTSSTYSSTWA